MRDRTVKIWAVTEKGAHLGQRLCAALDGELCLPDKPWASGFSSARTVSSLGEGIASGFHGAGGHVFVMATGIVVRLIASLLKSKAQDPAVVVMDEAGRFAVSLVSGHIGGANRLAQEAAAAVGAVPVITTATDTHGIASVDGVVSERGLVVENPPAIKAVNMALLEKRKPLLWDPMGIYADMADLYVPAGERAEADVVVDCSSDPAKEGALVIRPRRVTVGVGCNRGTDVEEILEGVEKAFQAGGISPLCLKAMASIDVKADEEGILKAAERLGVSLSFYTKDQLSGTDGVVTPSAAALKHVGTVSVCEAAAIQSARMGSLVVPKVKGKNVTAALAMASSTL
ncbi:cobalt-precorrin 5A hydrolase [Desulfoluna butyratoxydans]|uniref:Cobalamin synthesis g c-terminus n=1 Tax=Desulfoluna butyratoxydans TaxID=231438 RepID=A0A4U8YTE1_9BACT|nr:cobalamin biosynthesis protein [Desulfoluna butyratoxydans]VFQ47250.1 cobalamin synthesis g c-terminus [Desulfoluna butyratoxydans]